MCFAGLDRGGGGSVMSAAAAPHTWCQELLLPPQLAGSSAGWKFIIGDASASAPLRRCHFTM